MTTPQRRRRAAALRLYAKLRADFLTENPSCWRCGAGPTELHHAAGRVGSLLTDTSRFIALCRSCHRFLTEHPSEAFREGWSQRRIGRSA